MLNAQNMMFQEKIENALNSAYPVEQHISGSARLLFENALRRGRMSLLRKAILGSHIELKDLNAMPGKVRLQGGDRLPGVRSISIDSIVGSESRSRDFDRDFNPLKSHISSRWQRVASAREAGIDLPPVELVRVGKEYYVRDGHHRISVARARGQRSIEAVIVNA